IFEVMSGAISSAEGNGDEVIGCAIALFVTWITRFGEGSEAAPTGTVDNAVGWAGMTSPPQPFDAFPQDSTAQSITCHDTALVFVGGGMRNSNSAACMKTLIYEGV